MPLQDQTIAYGPGETRLLKKKAFRKPIPINDNVYLDREDASFAIDALASLTK